MEALDWKINFHFYTSSSSIDLSSSIILIYCLVLPTSCFICEFLTGLLAGYSFRNVLKCTWVNDHLSLCFCYERCCISALWRHGWVWLFHFWPAEPSMQEKHIQFLFTSVACQRSQTLEMITGCLQFEFKSWKLKHVFRAGWEFSWSYLSSLSVSCFLD